MKWILPLLMVLVAAAGGAGAGYFLQPAAESSPQQDISPVEETSGEAVSYYKLPNQFVVPLLENGRMSAMVVMTLSLQLRGEPGEQIPAQEPKLRDEFLRVMFDHANAGGFRGNFTSEAQTGPLRRALLESARKVVMQKVEDVLITDLLRQDQ